MFYLASSSPRRRQLLDQIGARYRVIAVNVDETPMAAEVGAEYVLRLALAKARAGQAASGDGLPVLGADTALTLDQRILGKPRDRHDALEMLMALSGRVHKVMTALAWVDPQREDTRLSVSRVEFCAFDKASAEAYVASGEPLDKAGGYGIQGLGALLVARLEGSYSGVMGLPLYETGQLLRRAGCSPLP